MAHETDKCMLCFIVFNVNQLIEKKCIAGQNCSVKVCEECSKEI